MRFLNGALLLAVATSSPTADDWPAAHVKTVFSEDGGRFVRIIPGDNVAATIGFKGARSGKNGRAEFYLRQKDRSYRLIADIVLPNPVAPVEALLSNAGSLITFDNWHNIGYGKAVVIYDARARIVRSYELEQLYAREQIDRIPTSTSSRWWRCTPHHFVEPREQLRVYAPEFSGGYFVFDLQTGGFTYTPGSAPCQAPVGPLSATIR